MSPRTEVYQLDRFGVRLGKYSINQPTVMVRVTRRTWTSAHWEVWWLTKHVSQYAGSRHACRYYALDTLAASGITPSFWQAKLHASQAVRRLHFKEYS